MQLRVVLIGPPGVGKGTQTEQMERNLGVKPLSSGAIFRHEIGARTQLGELAKTFIDAGMLVPDDVTISMMAKQIKTDEVLKSGFVLDGFPRTIEQAKALDTMLDELGSPLQHVLAIVVEDEVVVGRLSGRLGCSYCGAIYHRVTKPPKREELCDACGHELVVRSDDQPKSIRERLRVYHETTEPVISYYESTGRLTKVDGQGDPSTVYSHIAEALKNG